MSHHDLYIMLIIGGIFIVLGILGFIWSKVEESSWFNTITERIDVREFLDRSQESNALRIGGRICIAVGIVLLLVTTGFFIWGMPR
jgi:hypothetical protein